MFGQGISQDLVKAQRQLLRNTFLYAYACNKKQCFQEAALGTAILLCWIYRAKWLQEYYLTM